MSGTVTEAVADVVSALELDDDNTRAEVRVRNSRVNGIITVGLMIDFNFVCSDIWPRFVVINLLRRGLI